MGLRMLPTVLSPEEREMPEGEPVDMLSDELEEEEGIEEEDESMEGIMLEPVTMAMLLPVDDAIMPVAMGIMLADMELEAPPPRLPRRPDRGPSSEPVALSLSSGKRLVRSFLWFKFILQAVSFLARSARPPITGFMLAMSTYGDN